MISDDLIDMLIDPDPSVRKQGVTIIAKSKDPDALPYLAEVYRDDENAEVRELARKAGIYIKKNASTHPSPPPQPDTGHTDLYGAGDLYDDENEDEDDADMVASVSDTPLPSDLRVSKVSEERAKGLLQQALDLNMRGDNQRAIKALERALATDPRLAYDSYTASFAATVTGLPGQEAIQNLMPDEATLNKMRRSGSSSKRSGMQLILAYGVIVAGVLTLLGFVLMPWFAIGSTQVTEPTTGETFTVNEIYDLMAEMMGEFPDTPEANEVVDILNSINFDASGLDTALYASGINDLGTMVSMNRLADYLENIGLGVFSGFFSAEEFEILSYTNEPEPLQYSLLAVPAGAVIALLLGIMLLMRGGSMLMWGLVIIMGLLVVVPAAYYFTAGEEALRMGINWRLLLEIPTPDQSLIGLGFWVSLIGGLLIVIIPFVALLTEPSEERF